jgi:hypothetical protein
LVIISKGGAWMITEVEILGKIDLESAQVLVGDESDILLKWRPKAKSKTFRYLLSSVDPELGATAAEISKAKLPQGFHVLSYPDRPGYYIDFPDGEQKVVESLLAEIKSSLQGIFWMPITDSSSDACYEITCRYGISGGPLDGMNATAFRTLSDGPHNIAMAKEGKGKIYFFMAPINESNNQLVPGETGIGSFETQGRVLFIDPVLLEDPESIKTHGFVVEITPGKYQANRYIGEFGGKTWLTWEIEPSEA